MPPPPAACDIYREALTSLKFGDALWEPGPLPNYRRVRPGDVGYIREGTFHLLFPAGISLESTAPGTDVPLSFETLDVGLIIPRNTRPPGYLRTHTVKQVGVDVGNSLAIPCPVGPGAKIAFELTSEQGAVLVTNHPTYREDIEKRGEFETHIKKHYDSWVGFARAKGHGDVKPVLVTGVDLTKQFAAIAYSDNQTNMGCDFSVEAPAVTSESVSVWGSWRTLGSAHTTCGPDQYRVATRRVRRTYDSYVSESEIPEGNDQCVFIRYYTIRKFLGFKHLKAAAGPHRLPEGDAGGGGAEVSCLEGNQSVTHNVPLDDRDSFDVVAEFIFQRSGATSLLLHHDDIQDFIGENEEETVRLLEESAVIERLEVDENGIGQLAPATGSRVGGSLGPVREDTNVRDYVDASKQRSTFQDITHVRTSPVGTSVMPTDTKRLKGRDPVFSALDVAIDALSRAKGISSAKPAITVFGLAISLLTTIRDNIADEPNYVELGLACAQVCEILHDELKRRRLDELPQSVWIGVEKLSTTLVAIHETIPKRRRLNLLPRFSSALGDRKGRDEKAISAWSQDLFLILYVFKTEFGINTQANTQTLVADLHRNEKDQQGVGYQHLTGTSIPTGELPPPAPKACFGRDKLIEHVVDLAENLDNIALVGAGGIGKTTIALTVLHDLRIKERFGDNRRFIRCDQFPVSRLHFLSRLSKVIGAGIENPEDLTPLRPSLSSRKMILFLDNSESMLDPQGADAREIYAIVEELGRFSNISLGITSRITTVPPYFKRPIIPALSMEAACHIFYSIYEDGGQSEVISTLVEELDFHALSIALLATVASCQMLDYDRLAKEWREQRSQMLSTDFNESLAATIELSLASPTFRTLGPHARGLLEVIAFFPQGIDGGNLDWLFPTIPDKRVIFGKFRTLSLTLGSGSFITMLAPFRDYLRPGDPESSPLLCTARDHYFARLSPGVDPNKPGSEEMLWITSDDANVEYLLDVFTAIDPNSDDVWRACANFVSLLQWCKPRSTVLGRKIEGLSDHHHLKPTCLLQLSRLADATGAQLERKRLLTHCLMLERGLEDDNRIALVLMLLSDANRLLGLREEGIQQSKEALEVYERLGNAVGQAQCSTYLARSLHSDGQLDAAEEAASRAITLLPQKGQEYDSCQIHRTLGYIYDSKGETEKAIRHFETAIQIASHFNWQHELFWNHHALATVFSNEDRIDDAQTHIDQAESHTFGRPYLLGHAMMIQAKIWCQQNKFEDAVFEASGALDIYEKLGAAGDVERCRDFLRFVEQAMEGGPNISISDSGADKGLLAGYDIAMQSQCTIQGSDPIDSKSPLKYSPSP